MANDRTNLRRAGQLALGCALSVAMLAALSFKDRVLDAEAIEKRLETIRARPTGPIERLPEPIKMPYPDSKLQRNPFAALTGVAAMTNRAN